MLTKWKGNLNIRRPKVIEDIVAPNYDQYYYMMFMLPILLNAQTVVETGLGWGHSSKIFLESLSTMNGDRTLHTYELNESQYMEGSIKLEDVAKSVKDCNFQANWELHLMDSLEGGNNWKGPKIPLLYLDSDHSYEHVKNELTNWMPHMSEKSIIMTDDVWCENLPHQAINIKNPGLCPTDPYYAFEEFEKDGFELLTMTYPQGKSLLIRGM